MPSKAHVGTMRSCAFKAQSKHWSCDTQALVVWYVEPGVLRLNRSLGGAIDVNELLCGQVGCEEKIRSKIAEATTGQRSVAAAAAEW